MINPATGWFEIVELELPVLEPVSSDAPDTKKGRISANEDMMTSLKKHILINHRL
jgi:hypothetical protein